VVVAGAFGTTGMGHSQWRAGSYEAIASRADCWSECSLERRGRQIVIRTTHVWVCSRLASQTAPLAAIYWRGRCLKTSRAT